MKFEFKRSLLAFSVSFLSGYSHAFEALSDDNLSQIVAQDGISFRTTADNISMDRAFWQEDGKELQFRNISMNNVDTTLEMDFGADSDLSSATPALGIKLTVKPILISVGSIGLCNSGATCTSTFGDMAFELPSTSPAATFSFFNTNGLFDGSSSNFRNKFNISKANIYFGQTYDADGAGPTAPVRNLLILKNLTLNGAINGQLTVDQALGLRATGTLSLTRDATTRTHGLQFDIAHRANLSSGYTTAGSSEVMRFGLSGNITNLDWRLKADNTLSLGTSPNAQGIKMNFSGVLDKNNFQMEVGRSATYSMLFRNWVDFANGAAIVPSSPDFTLGDMYFNLITSGGSLPNFTTGNGAGFGTITAAGDALSLAMRGANFQAYPKVLSFQQNTSPFTTTSQAWSLISAVYNLDANLLLYPDGHPNASVTPKRGIGFDVKMATTGRDATGKEGTHFLVADPTAGSYVGMRNVDAKIELTNGQIFLVDSATDGIDGMKLTAKNMRFDIAGELAVGSLPNGSSVTTVRNDDAMVGVRIRMEGDLGIVFAPPPYGGYLPIIAVPLLNIPVGLGISGQLRLVDPNSGWHTASLAQSVVADPDGLRNSLVLREPVDGTELQFADISGTLDILSEHIKKGEFTDNPAIIGGQGTDDFSDVSRIEIGNQVITLATAFQFGKGTTTADIVRIGDIALGFDNDANPATAIPEANRYRLGEIVLTGGRLYTQLNIFPQ